MDPDNVITIRTYPREIAAHIARSALESSGIEAAVSADDCGGSHPGLQIASGVRLLVDAKDYDKAEEVLALFEQENKEDDLIATPDDIRNDKRPSRFLWFVVGALLASCGWGIHLYSGKYWTGVFRYDFNRDGRYDSWWTYEGGHPVKIEQDKDSDGKPDLFFHYDSAGLFARTESDQNFDGNVDLWQYHTNNLVVSAERDANFDGRIDSRFIYQHGVETSSEHDTDYNGKFDSFAIYRAGIIQTVKVRPNESRVVARQEEYSDGILCTELVDTDMDGAFDIKRTFDSMGIDLEETDLRRKTQNN